MARSDEHAPKTPWNRRPPARGNPVWRGFASRVSGRGIAAGHYLAEEAPEEVLAELLPFLTGAEA